MKRIVCSVVMIMGWYVACGAQKADSTFSIALCLHDVQQQQRALPGALCKQLLQISGVELHLLHPLTDNQKDALADIKNVHHFDVDQRNVREVIKAQVDIMAQADLIITIDPLVAYVGGTLQVPTWFVASPVMQHALMQGDAQRYTSLRFFVESELTAADDVINDLVNAVRVLHQPRVDRVITEVSIGELVDKMTILSLKAERIKDSEKLAHVAREYETLRKTFEEHVVPSLPLEELITELTHVNGKMWDIADSLREKERSKSYGDEEFIKLARSVYHTNDHRVAIKRKIDEMLGSHIKEEKQYAQY